MSSGLRCELSRKGGMGVEVREDSGCLGRSETFSLFEGTLQSLVFIAVHGLDELLSQVLWHLDDAKVHTHAVSDCS